MLIENCESCEPLARVVLQCHAVTLMQVITADDVSIQPETVVRSTSSIREGVVT